MGVGQLICHFIAISALVGVVVDGMTASVV
jgi:hypothetical protein